MEHCGTKELETTRLRLRPIREGDAPALYAMLGDPLVVKYLRIDQYESEDTAKAYLSNILQGYTQADYYFWMLEEKAEGKGIGTIMLKTLSDHDEVGEIAFSLAHAYWHRGYMTEGMKAVLAFGLLAVGYNRIEAYHATGNPRSGHVMRSVGMLYEGMCREKYKNRLGYHDAHIYAILKKDVI